VGLVKTLTRIQSDDPVVTRLQDHLMGTLNPLLRSLSDSVGTDPWTALGVWVGPTAPAVTTTYANWKTTRKGYWGWIQTP
jgi:hypothetical protein